MAKKGEETVYISDWKKCFHVQTKAEQSLCKSVCIFACIKSNNSFVLSRFDATLKLLVF